MISSLINHLRVSSNKYHPNVVIYEGIEYERTLINDNYVFYNQELNLKLDSI